MEETITQIFTVSALVFSVVIALATVFVRKVIEAIFSKAKIVIPDKIDEFLIDIWKQWILRGLPMFLGGLAMFIFKDYPVPDVFAASAAGKVFFGIVGGLFSSPIYSIVKFHTRKHLPQSVKEKVNSIIPQMPKE